MIGEINYSGEVVSFISNLQNFKFELKKGDHNRLSQLLLEFDFIEELISSHLGEEASIK